MTDPKVMLKDERRILIERLDETDPAHMHNWKIEVGKIWCICENPVWNDPYGRDLVRFYCISTSKSAAPETLSSEEPVS